MKFLSVFVLGLCMALVMSETCSDTDDCDHEVCVGDGWTVNCHQHTCTCEHDDETGAACLDIVDCTGRCPPGQSQHCIDGSCRCTRN